MLGPRRNWPATPSETELSRQLVESQAIVNALRSGQVDALVREAGIILLGDADKPYVTFFQAMRDGGLTLDANGRLLNCNGRFAELVRATRTQLLGRPFVDFVAAADRTRLMALLSAGCPVADDLELVDSCGRGRPVSLSATPLDIADQHMTCVLVADQSERALRNAALAESELKYRLLAENGTDWVFWMDDEGAFLYSSSACQALTGHAPAEYLRDAGLMRRIVHPDDLELYLAHGRCRGTLAACEPEIEFRIVHADGRVRWLAHSCHPMLDAEGHTIGRRGSNRDVTEKRVLMQALAQHNQRLEQTVTERTVELVAARDAAESANRAKSAFLANMSHEMRTPLNGVLGLTQLLLKSPVSAQQSDRLHKIETSGGHLLGIINDVLDLARIEAGRILPEHIEFSPPQAVQAAVAVVSEGAASRGIAIEVDVERLPRRALGDAKRFVQMLVNYLGNAVKFSERGPIRIRGRVVEDGAADLLVRMEVEDRGIGIPRDVLPRLFEPFEQVDSSMTRRFGGTGLGLAITRRLARLMGGEAGAESEPDVGSTFWLTARLGRVDAPDGPIGDPNMASALPRLPSVFRAQRVLIVEDDPVSAEIAAEVLRCAGLVPDLACNGAEAVERTRANSYAAILMDMHMPVLDGVAAARCIRSLPNRATVPIIALTADAFPEARAICRAAGMNEVVVKPFEPSQLFAALERWIGGTTD
ncbi:MAG TPA: ATP-binding protein [Rubrivivax sp.]|nr:ATP-binding protein [Rubrivivax sp.]